MSKVSKVIYGNTTVIDITDSTVNANNLLSGEKAYGADGEPVIGALTMGSTINVTAVDSSFYGETLSLTNGVTTLSTTFDNSGDATFTSVIMTGLLTLTSNGLSQQISIPSYGTYNITFDPVPEGATVTPTDDIQLWLRCAHITDKSYTTLSEVLADRETFETLIADSNACDYMARSTTWAGGDNLVPTMTSATTPSGEASGINYNNTYPPYLIFDGNDSTFCAINAPSNTGTGMTDRWVQYHFTDAVIVNKFLMKYQNTYGSYHDYITKVKLQGSNNGSTFTDITTETISSTTEEKIFSNNTAYEYYRFLIVDGTVTNYNMISFMILTLELGFIGIVNSQDAMALIGKYDYCSNALLGNATWAEAIANSDYFEEVLNVEVPVMTSATTPSGEVSASSTLDGRFPAYQAFDGNTSTLWHSSAGVPQWIAYDFAQSVIISFVKLRTHGDVGGPKVSKIQYSNDNITWTDYGDDASFVDCPTNATWYSKTYSTNIKARYFRLYVSESNYSNNGSYYVTFAELQFYGRASKEVLIPLVPVMTSNTTPSGVASADSVYGTGYEAYRAFDNAVSTTDAWISGSTASSYNFPHWIQYQFPTAQVVGGLHFKNYSTGSYGVKTFKVQGSNDGTTWTDLYSGTGINAGGGTLQEFYFDNTTAYLYYRLYITEGYSVIQCGICYLQFLRTQSLTNIIHSCANDTIYYYENGSPIIIATTNSSGIGICDFSLLDNKIYTLYSTVAKDPSNLSNPYSKQVRITNTTYGCTTELYVMPDVLKMLYWYGYESGELEDMTTANGYSSSWTLVQPTHNTNNITVAITGHPQLGGVATPKMSGDNKFCIICSTSGTVTLPPCLIKTAVKAEPFDNKTATLIDNLSSSTDKYFETSSVSLTNEYVATYSRSGYANNSLIIKAFWYE